MKLFTFKQTQFSLPGRISIIETPSSWIVLLSEKNIGNETPHRKWTRVLCGFSSWHGELRGNDVMLFGNNDYHAILLACLEPFINYGYYEKPLTVSLLPRVFARHQPAFFHEYKGGKCMFVLRSITRGLLIFFLFHVSGCSENSLGPNEIGGEPNLDLTREGGVFGISLGTDSSIPGLDNLRDSIYISKNNNGIVTMRVRAVFDTVFTNALQEALGTTGMPDDLLHDVLETYVKRFNATLDTTNKSRMTLQADLVFKVTSEGIQEFVSSGGDHSHPFTIVKYNANVGDTYQFTNTEGVDVTRTVTYKSTEDDYPVAFWLLKVIKVDEQKSDQMTKKLTYVTNHKYGLVAIEVDTITGKELRLTIFPPTL